MTLHTGLQSMLFKSAHDNTSHASSSLPCLSLPTSAAFDVNHMSMDRFRTRDSLLSQRPTSLIQRLLMDILNSSCWNWNCNPEHTPARLDHVLPCTCLFLDCHLKPQTLQREKDLQKHLQSLLNFFLLQPCQSSEWLE